MPLRELFAIRRNRRDRTVKMSPPDQAAYDRMWVLILAAAVGWIPVLCVTDSPSAVAGYGVVGLIAVSVAAYAAKRQAR